MKQITLHRVIIKNFRSYKKECIEFFPSYGLKYLGGQNNAEPRLGANGAGKSTFWNAVCWCNYGTGLKGEKISSLLSWGELLAEVLIEYQINGIVHTLYRSGPPVKIELDGQPASQEQVDQFLGLTKERFLHSIIFGQGKDLFPDLPIPKRSELLDDVLELGIWEKASKLATDKTSELEKVLVSKNSDLAYIQGQIDQLQSEQYIEGQIEFWVATHNEELTNCKSLLDKWDSEKDARIAEIENQIEEWREKKQEELEGKVQEIEALERQINDLDSVILGLPEISKEQIEEIATAVKQVEYGLNVTQKQSTELEVRLKQIHDDRDFWIKNSTCPSCKQLITEEHKCDHILESETEEQELAVSLTSTLSIMEELKIKLDTNKKQLDFVKQQIIQKQEQARSYHKEKKRLQFQIEGVESAAKIGIQELNNDKHPYVRQLKNIQVEGNPFHVQLEQLQKRINPYLDLLTKNKQSRQELENKKATLTKEILQVKSSIVAAEYWKHGFKRIRLFFINQILEVLQIEIQSAISALGLENWSVKLATESLTKSETVKLGVQIHIKSPIAEGEWSVWSGGESQRLRLAIAMGLASLIQRASGCFYSFEVWDEPTNWLGTEGIEDLLQALQYRADTLKKSIWVIDHRALTFSGFKEIWIATKELTGSSINMLSMAEA